MRLQKIHGDYFRKLKSTMPYVDPMLYVLAAAALSLVFLAGFIIGWLM